MRKRLFRILSAGMVLACPALAADALVFTPDCESPQLLVVVTGGDVPSLLGQPLAAIRLYAGSQRGLFPVTLQIDPRDDEGRYQIRGPGDAQSQTAAPLLDDNDELVFRAADAGPRLSADALAAQPELVELSLRNTLTGKPGWIYASVSGKEERFEQTVSVRYDVAADAVQTAVYTIGFSRQTPFLIDTLRWKTGGSGQWSPDVLDTMKIRHRGKLFGFIDFTRTGADYNSRLLAIKSGPLRVIRRTENAVRVLWKLKTPRVYVDYVMSADSFVMDTIVDIPFRIGMFFSDIDTLTTVDWNSAPGLPPVSVSSREADRVLVVDGTMNPEKHRFNEFAGTRFSASSRFGDMQVQLRIPEDFPITPWLYFNDAIETPDPPEQVPGQFGHVGFRNTGWENIDTEVHHLQFKVCLQAKGEPR
ncbi:MAG: hypothetical protein RQ736_14110 [Thiogranum sp.]|nr:hypothetical protein [Thiogranum sp.]